MQIKCEDCVAYNICSMVTIDAPCESLIAFINEFGIEKIQQEIYNKLLAEIVIKEIEKNDKYKFKEYINQFLGQNYLKTLPKDLYNYRRNSIKNILYEE